MSDVWGVPHHVTYPMMHLMLPTLPLKRQTPVKNITSSQLRLRAVNIHIVFRK